MTSTNDSSNETAAWLINHMGPHGINALRNGILTGYTTTLGSDNLIVENIMMNDDRNNTEYRCVIVLHGTIQRRSDRTFMFVAGEYHYRVQYHVYVHSTYICLYIATCCDDLMLHTMCISICLLKYLTG